MVGLSSNLLLWIGFPVWRELKLYYLQHLIFFFAQLWIGFPVWRELKLECSKREEQWNFRRLWIGFPVWRELKPNCSATWIASSRSSSLDRLSRLKGIETKVSQRLAHSFILTLDRLSRLKGIETSRTPFLSHRLSRQSLDRLSRLKGIETTHSHTHIGRKASHLKLWIGFPVWRELKLFLALRDQVSWKGPLDRLSRLKGMETKTIFLLIASSFPLFLWIGFPVWRELKQDRALLSLLQAPKKIDLWIGFPVWREWKLFKR